MRALIRALREQQVDVVTAFEAGMIERPDEEHLTLATSEGRVVVTANQGDFCRLHADFLARGMTHGGIIVVAQQRFPLGEQLRRLLRLLDSLSADDMRDRVEFLSAWG